MADTNDATWKIAKKMFKKIRNALYLNPLAVLALPNILKKNEKGKQKHI